MYIHVCTSMLANVRAFVLIHRRIICMYNCCVRYIHLIVQTSVFFTYQNNSTHRLEDYIVKIKKEIGKNANGNEAIYKKLRKASVRLRILEESKLGFRNVNLFYRYANKRLSREMIGSREVGTGTLHLIRKNEYTSQVF